MVSKSGCKGWVEQRTNLEKTLLSLSSLLLLTLLLVILFGITYKGSKTESTVVREKEGCWTKECVQTAGDLLSLMDKRADPCTDLFKFACGGYGHAPGQTTSVAESSVDKTYLSLKRMLESPSPSVNNVDDFDSAKSLYDTCMRFGDLRRYSGKLDDMLRKLMKDFGVGTWPVIDAFYDDDRRPLEVKLASLTLLGVPVAFRMEIIEDPRVKGSYIMKLSPGGPRETNRTATDVRADIKLRADMMYSFYLLGVPDSRIAPGVDDILNVENYFVSLDQEKENRCGTTDLLSPQESEAELNRLIPEMNWTNVLSVISQASEIEGHFAVELHCKEKIRDYLVYLKDETDKTIFNYLGWRFFSTFADYIGPAFRHSRSGDENTMPKWKGCIQLVERYDRPVLAQALTIQNLDERVRNKVRQVATATMKGAERLLSQTKWLNEKQKSRILKQVADTNVHLPFESKHAANGNAALRLQGLSVDNFTRVVVGLQRQWVINRLRKLAPTSDPDEDIEAWLPTMISDGLVSPQDSSIAVYFDKVQEPYLRLQGSDWLNYGGFGVFIAREISSALLYQRLGSTLDDRVLLWDLWYSNRNASGCLLNSFSDVMALYSEPGLDESILRERFLDRSSLEIAYKTARSSAVPGEAEILPALDMSEEQMFFIAYAQTFCEVDSVRDKTTELPMSTRVNNAVAISKSFAEAFRCGSSTSTPKCELWR